MEFNEGMEIALSKWYGKEKMNLLKVGITIFFARIELVFP